jgi:hypothetical protein
MPVYTFDLEDGSGRIGDEQGVVLSDRAQARDYARAVVRELMEYREAKTRSWQLDVYEDGKKAFEIPFDQLDRTLDHLPPELRTMVIALSDRVRSLHEVMAATYITLRESRALVARSRGRPYLATIRGEPTIRDS